MSQGPLCPNLIKKVHREVSQKANHNLPCAMLLGLSINLNHLKITQAISQKPINQIKNFKKVVLSYLFTHLCAIFWLKIQNTNGRKSLLNFLTSEKSAPNGPPNGPTVIWSQFVWLFGGLRCSNVSSTNHQLTLQPYLRPFMV